jgi:alkaline phosphatase D
VSDALTRRTLLGAGGAAALALSAPGLAGARRARVAQTGERPLVTHGVQSGDVAGRRAVLWARADRPARMLVDVSPTESFRRVRRVGGPLVTEATDFTGKLDLRGLPPGTDVFYRVRFEDADRPGHTSEPVVGRLRTPPRAGRPVSFVWGGDTAGQGWGIDVARGGMRTYETMRRLEPDFFLHSGDTIYADGPLSETVALDDGTVWRNLVTPEKAKVAETLAEFRGNHAYNLLDENVRRMNAEVPVLAQWDDHETTNNWYPGEVLEDPRYTVREVDLLAARARRAFLEYWPIRSLPQGPDRVYRSVRYGPALELFIVDMRTYRGPNSPNQQAVQSRLTDLLGPAQLEWLKRRLARSTATWKVIAADMPIGLVVPDGRTAFEAIAQGDGEARGRELEIAELLSFLRREGIVNTVWLTADVHYTAAHHYDPSRARFQDFEPFWEFVSGPLHAGTFGPNALDDTFGPEVRYVKAPPEPNAPPSAGLQFFGHVTIAGDTRVMTVRLVDVEGETLFSVDLEPRA